MMLHLSESLIQAISWTVIHSIWQISLLALFLLLANIYLPKKQSTLRYHLGLAAMGLGLVGGITTFIIYYTDTGVNTSGSELLISLEQAEIMRSSSMIGESWQNLIYDHSFLITQIWIVGVIILTLKLLIGYGYIQYLNHHSGLIENPHLEYKLEKLKSKLGITTRIIIAETHKVITPIVTGFIKPTILFPVGLITHLTPEEIEAIIAHELGHIKRNDWIINMVQSVIEILFYYHPAMWWISAQVRKERENCCDDYALQNGFDRLSYARILVKLKEIELDHKPFLALSFLNSKNALMNRIKRILGQSPSHSHLREKLVALVLICTVVVAFAGTRTSNGIINIPFIDSQKDIKLELAELNHIHLPSSASLQSDTIPGNNKSKTITLKQNEGKSYMIESENGEITKMEVDGKVIPPEEYDQYIEEMPNGSWNYNFNFDHKFGDMPFKMDFDDMGLHEMDEEQSRHLAESMERLSEKLGRMNLSELEGMDWDKLGNMKLKSFDMDSLMSDMWSQNGEQQMKLGEMMEKLGDLRLEKLEGLHQLEELEGLKGLEELENLKELGRLKGFDNFNFEFPDYDGLNNRWENNANQKISRSLNQDGLLKIDEENKIELSGKYLKINGEKQPSNIHEKYKRMFEESTGMELSDDSKVKFNVIGKESKRGMRRI